MPTNITNTSITTDNLTVDTNTVHVDSTNNRVGIGTTSPQYPLQVNGNVDILQVKGAAGNGFVRFTSNNSLADFSLGADDGSGIGSGAFILYDRSNNAYRIKLNSAGAMTVPGQPSFLMKKYTGAASGMADNSVWTYDEALTNIGGHASISTGRFTASVAGNYCFMWHNIGGSGASTFRSTLRKNGSDQWGAGYKLAGRNYQGTGSYPNGSAQVVVPLAASDYVDIYQSGGAAYSDTTDGAWFCGFLIG
tara:strand:+ start:464 stop:1210 length:747 start_codon:yes stop_codon:yes gene_type:complete